jgi:DNA-binding IclR family transcriptional regulator
MSRVPAATRALALLRAMAELGQPASAELLAKKLGLPRSSCYQLLQAIEQEGFAIHYLADKRWGLGIAAWELGSAYQRHEPIERLARPILKRLVSDLERRVPVVGHLGVLDGSDVLYLLEERPARSLKLVTDIGVRLPAHLTASGRAMLALLDQKQISASFRGLRLGTRTGLGPKDLGELKDLLALEKNQGYALEVDEVSMGYASIGTAIIDNLDHPLAGIAITMQSRQLEKLDLSELAAMMLHAATELSRKFGHHA